MGGLAFPNLDFAIGKAEGFGKPGAIPTMAHNPGDVTAGPFASAHGAIGSMTAEGGQQIAVFPDTATGYAATDALISQKYAGGSIDDLAAGWLAGSPAQSQQNWSDTVSGALGVKPSTAVSQLGAGAPTDSGPGIAQRVINAVTGGATQAATNAVFGGVSWSRVAGFILGLIVLAGAIFLFKPAQQIVTSTARRAVA